MTRNHEYELTRRLEALVHAKGTGRADFLDWELLLWFDAQRVTKRIWRELRERLVELSADETFDFMIFGDWHGGYSLLHPAHVKTFSEQLQEAE